MEEKEICNLDLNGCKTTYDIHCRIRDTLGYPEWYGKNWSAFRDMMRGVECMTLNIHGFTSLPSVLENHKEIMLNILEDTKKETSALKAECPHLNLDFEYYIID